MSQKTYKSVGVLDRWTAGYFATLVLKKSRPDLKVELIESYKILVTRVGESTTRIIINFLHKDLGFDAGDFFKKVKPAQSKELDWNGDVLLD